MAQKKNVSMSKKSVMSMPKGQHLTGADGKKNTTKGKQNTAKSTNKVC